MVKWASSCVDTELGDRVMLKRFDSSDFGLMGIGEQSSQKWEIPCLKRRWTAVQNLTPLALSSAKKIRNRTNIQKIANKQ